MTFGKKPIRVLCVFAKLDRGGAETMCMELYRHVDRSKVQFDFVKHTPERGVYEDEIRALGGKIYEAPTYKVYNHLSYCRWWRRHLKAHPEHRIIHGHYFTIAAVFFKEAHKFGCVTIGHSHSTKTVGKRNLVAKMRTAAQQHFLNKLEDTSDYCFACSMDAGKWLFPNKNFMVLKNAIDVKKFAFSEEVRTQVQKELGLSNENLTVGVVGRLTTQKNPLGVIEIFKALHERNNKSVLLWVGTGEMRETIEERLKRENLNDAVIMTGVRADVNRLMQAMDVFILPSLWEGLGIVAIEAQASGMPCLCSDAVPREAALTELCSFLPLEDPDIWAEMILATDKHRKVVGEKICVAVYDISSTSKWLEEFYCSCQTKELSILPE